MSNIICRRLLLACLIVLLSLAGCTDNTDQPVHFYAFGTIIEVTLPGLDTERKSAMEKRLIERFQHWQTYWQPWQGEGLAAVNRALATGGSAKLDQELHDLIRSADVYHEQSGGLFDPAIGGLIRLWGFNREDRPSAPPPADALDNWLQHRPHYGELELQESVVATDNPELQLDFGGFAKGYALDKVAALLAAEGIDDALINAGGDLIALGNAGTRRWRIGIRHPRRSGVIASVELNDGEALVTSGDYERYFMQDDKRYHHILDPRTGRPANDAIAVSVIDNNAARADAAATALFVAGAQQWRQTAAAMNIECAMLIDDRGSVHLSGCMRERLAFKTDPEGGIELTP